MTNPWGVRCLVCLDYIPWSEWDWAAVTHNLDTGESWVACPRCHSVLDGDKRETVWEAPDSVRHAE